MVLDLIGARKLDNYAKDATAGGLWTSTTTFRVTCPVGKRWFFVGCTSYRDAAATKMARIYDVSDNVLQQVYVDAATTGIACFPSTVVGVTVLTPLIPFVLDATDYIELTFGAAQGAGAFASVQVLEVSL